tara:strand:- start:946 stop:1260 length:315 start_codon:yes stop_codon:yes gene_type:complete
MDLVYFILCSYGLTQILLYGSMFNKIRPTKDWLRGTGKLFYCAMCMGFHVGWLLVLFGSQTNLWDYEVNVVNLFLLGCLAAGSSYILNRIINDDGLSVSLNKNE